MPTYHVASYGWRSGGATATFVNAVPGEAALASVTPRNQACLIRANVAWGD